MCQDDNPFRVSPSQIKVRQSTATRNLANRELREFHYFAFVQHDQLKIQEAAL